MSEQVQLSDGHYDGDATARASGSQGSQRSRQRYTLAEKITIVRESQQPGVSQASISRKYQLGANVLATWRKSLCSFDFEQLAGNCASGEADRDNLRRKIADLERLLGQKTFEIELLRSRLQDTATPAEKS